MKILFSPFSPYVRKCLVTGHEVGLNGRIQLLPSAANPVNRDQDIIPNNPLVRCRPSSRTVARCSMTAV